MANLSICIYIKTFLRIEFSVSIKDSSTNISAESYLKGKELIESIKSLVMLMHLNAFIANLCCVKEICNRNVMRHDVMRMLDCKQDIERRLTNSNKKYFELYVFGAEQSEVFKGVPC